MSDKMCARKWLQEHEAAVNTLLNQTVQRAEVTGR